MPCASRRRLQNCSIPHRARARTTWVRRLRSSVPRLRRRLGQEQWRQLQPRRCVLLRRRWGCAGDRTRSPSLSFHPRRARRSPLQQHGLYCSRHGGTARRPSHHPGLCHRHKRSSRPSRCVRSPALYPRRRASFRHPSTSSSRTTSRARSVPWAIRSPGPDHLWPTSPARSRAPRTACSWASRPVALPGLSIERGRSRPLRHSSCRRSGGGV
jgi:hypothetical protein